MDICKKKKRKEYRSAEFVDSGSDSCTSPEQSSARTRHKTAADNALTPLPSDRMTRIHSYSWGASASQSPSGRKKRPPPTPVARPDAKRFKAGPFIEASDSDDNAANNFDDSDDDFSFDSRITAAPRNQASSISSRPSSTSSKSENVWPMRTPNEDIRSQSRPQATVKADIAPWQAKRTGLESGDNTAAAISAPRSKAEEVRSQSPYKPFARSETPPKLGKGLNMGLFRKMAAAKKQGTTTPDSRAAARPTTAVKKEGSIRPYSAANSSSLHKILDATKERTYQKVPTDEQDRMKPAIVEEPNVSKTPRIQAPSSSDSARTSRPNNVGSSVPVAVMLRPEREWTAPVDPVSKATKARPATTKPPKSFPDQTSSVTTNLTQQANSVPSTPGRPTPSAPRSICEPAQSPVPCSPTVLTQHKSPIRLPHPRATKDVCQVETAPVLESVDEPRLRAAAILKSPTTSTQLPAPSSAPSAEVRLKSPEISPAAEPYFEYTIHHTLTSSDSANVPSEISTQPLTSLDLANSSAKTSWQIAKQQLELLGYHCLSSASCTDHFGLSAYKAAITDIEDPSKTRSLNLRVERAEVGVLANHAPPPVSSVPLVNRTVYAVRLWKLLKTMQEDDADSDASASASNHADEDANTTYDDKTRTYHPLPPICSEIHTTLESANRTAKRVEIHLRHVKENKNELDKVWQTQNLQELDRKLEGLRKEGEVVGFADASSEVLEDEGGRMKGCWWSSFSGPGQQEEYELLVCAVGLSGPRNL